MYCSACGSDETYETTTLGQRWRTYLCRNGHSFTDVEERPSPAMGKMQGPNVPTPNDLLVGAGLLDPADLVDSDPIPWSWSMLIL